MKLNGLFKRVRMMKQSTSTDALTSPRNVNDGFFLREAQLLEHVLLCWKKQRNKHLKIFRRKKASKDQLLLWVKKYQIEGLFWRTPFVLKSQKSLWNKKVNKRNEYCQNWSSSEMSWNSTHLLIQSQTLFNSKMLF